MGVAIAGLTSDARILSNYLRNEAMKYRIVYDRPQPVNRAMDAIGTKAQKNTQSYGGRPYGVGLLAIGKDSTGPHLFEFSPSGIISEYYAYSIGSRSQTARTYLERHYQSFANDNGSGDCSASTNDLIIHGLKALRDTLPQDKHLDCNNITISYIDSNTDFTIVDGEDTQKYLDLLEDNISSNNSMPVDDAE
ncbi:putative proteasome subunit alpha type-6 [Zancudomyces culisetae]|uniref:Putative proteasome subunit alpha type-6 n=1 Tax=Zancudomyces culisetae TaxID=1213189 RepID=A0A1R1PGU1_ZANCU|nr:putative proteasome subunit alpha type-6 [Zancudomyces culisetae]OMH83952.1 putative proteasome subunit alpha type-6 [Zancudomyces culisetae]|eukprot:OMH80196.1 putative proteasome subunit alpha type-6 [Zancudomyces culisetae]